VERLNAIAVKALTEPKNRRDADRSGHHAAKNDLRQFKAFLAFREPEVCRHHRKGQHQIVLSAGRPNPLS
jgi:hypothetical protein